VVTRIPLDGERWRCKAYLGDEWRMRRAFAGDTNDVHGWIDARVPGSVVADLVRAGDPADPLIDRNSRLLEWVSERSWVYRRDVSLPGSLEGRRVIVHFEGIDHAAHVFWNAVPVGSHEGMFVPAGFDVTHVAKPGSNVISVVLSPAPHSEPQVGHTDRVRNAKSRMTYGWDFCPRLVHVGLWDRAWVDIVDGLRIGDVTVRPRLAEDLSRARVIWQVAVETSAEGAFAVEVAILRDGRTVGVATWRGPSGRTGPLNGTLDLEHPDLWWPNGHGAQPLYRLRVRARLEGAGSDEREVTFGIRRIELVPNAAAPPAARPYTLMVNGHRVYLKGWNWVPMDIHHGVEDPDRLAHLVDLAARAHVNLLRVWGGGLIEKEAFYRACDRHGIMVWQEFPLSSSGIASTPSRDPDYATTQFNEPFPNGFCTSAVDYRGRPKRAYYAVAEAYRPLQASAAFPTITWGGRATFTARLWVSTGRNPLHGRLDAGLLSAGGAPAHQESWDAIVPSESSAYVASVDWPLDGLTSDVFWLDLRVDSMHPAHPQQAASAPGYARFSSSHFSLMPSEQRQVSVAWTGAPDDDRGIIVGGWNTEAVVHA
jgi:beta-mannosidase